MASNKDIDISLEAGLDLSTSEKQLIEDVKALNERLVKAGHNKIKLKLEIDDSTLKSVKNLDKNSKNLGTGLAKNLINQFNVVNKEAQKQIKDISKSIFSIVNTEVKTGNESPIFISQLDKLGDVIINNSNILKERMGIYDQFYAYFQKLGKIKISDTIKSDLGDDWKELKQLYPSKFVVNKNGIELDSIYQEMSSKFKDIFSGTANPTAQFRELTTAIKNYRNDVSTLEPIDPDKVVGFDDDVFQSVIVNVTKMREAITEKMVTPSTDSIRAEAKSMEKVEESAKIATTAKNKFADANREVAETANVTERAVDQEHDAFMDMNNIDSILAGINLRGQQGNSVFQMFGDTLRNTFMAYSAANLLQDALREIVNAGKEAVQTVSELDKATTSLMMATGKSREEVSRYMKNYNELGREIGDLTSSVAASADTFLRQGRTIEETNQLIRDSIVLSKVSNASSEESAKILTATINGFQLAAKDAERVNDILTSIDLESSADASGIGESLTKVASMANTTNMSLEKTVALLATMKDVTQDSDQAVGTALKSVLSRINQIKAGKFVDAETGEALNDTEKVLNKIGVSMRQANGQFLDSETIIDNLAKKWKTLDKNSKQAVSTATAGTYQYNKLIAALDNYDKVEYLTNVAKNASGTAKDKFETGYLDSIESKTKSLQASLENLASTTISEDLYKSILDVSAGLVDATAESNILKSSLTGLASAGAVYTFQQLTGFVRGATQEFSNLSAAMDIVKAGNIGTTQLQQLIDLTGGLSNSQVRLLLSTQALTDAQKISILMNRGMGQAEAEAALQTYGLASAQTTATTATVTFGSALKGMYLTLAANPIMTIGLAVSAVAMAFNKYQQSVEEAKRKTREKAESYKQLVSEIESLNEELKSTDARLKELNSKDSLTLVEQEEKQKLEETNNELERTLRIKQAIANVEAKEVAKSANDVLTEKSEKSIVKSNVTKDVATYEDVDPIESLNEYLNLAERQKQSLKETQDELAKLEASYGEGAEAAEKMVQDDEWKRLTEQIKYYEGAITETEATVSKKYSDIESSSGNLVDSTGKVIEGCEETHKRVEAVTKRVDEYFGDTTEKAEEVANGVSKAIESLSKPFTKSEMISEINGLSEGFEELDKIYKSISDNNPFDFKLLDDKAFKDTFSGLGEEYTNFIETIGNSPNDINACKSAFNDLITAWINSKDILDRVDEGNANVAASTLKLMGVENAEEVISAALAQRKAEIAWSNEKIHASTVEEIQILAEECGVTGQATEAFYAYYVKKLLAETAMNPSGDIQALASVVNSLGLATEAWQKYYAVKARMEAIASDAYYVEFDENGNVVSKEQALSNWGQLAGIWQEKYAQDLEDMAKNVTYGGGNKSNSSSSSGSSSAKQNSDIDWIQRKIDIVNKKKQELQNALSDAYTPYTGLTNGEIQRASELLNNNLLSPGSFEFQEFCDMANKAGLSIEDFIDKVRSGEDLRNKQSILEELMAIDQQQINQYLTASDQYKKSYEELVALVPEYRDKIENGGDGIELVSGEKKTQIENAQNAWDKYQESLTKVKETESELKSHKSDWHDVLIEQSEKEIAQLERQRSLTESQISYYQAAGKIVTASMYQDNIDSLNQQQTKMERKLKTMKSKLSALNPEENTEEYYALEEAIDECEISMKDLATSAQEAYNELLQLPIKNQEIVVDMTNDIISAIEDYGAEVEATGKKLNADYYQTLIANGTTVITELEKQANIISDVMDNYEVGSDEWNDLYSQLKSVNSEMSGMVQNLQKWNEELLQMPLDNITTYTSDLNKVLSALNNVKNENETVINAVTTAIDDEIDRLNDEKEIYEDAVNAEKDALQEKLDLLKQQNEQLKLQQDYEQALYDLEVATTQKTVAVIRNGEKVYETNADSIREAQNSVTDALDALKENEIQSQIDELDDALDTYNEKLEEQIEALEKIKEKWSEIASEREKADNASLATEILGNGWQGKVISGNDADIYGMFKSMYNSNIDQINKYEEQINTTENIQSLIQDYITSYKEGTITFEQAQAGIKDLLSQMNEKMSATDNLQNVFEYLGTVNNTAANGDAVLKGIQDSLEKSSADLVNALAQYNENAGLISEYTSSWQQLTNNVASMLEVLEEVRDNLEDALNDIARRKEEEEEDDDDGGSSSSSGGGSGHNGNYTTKDLGYGPANDPNLKKYKDGIEKGIIGKTQGKSNFEVMKTLATNEIPIIAHSGEVILNEQQQARTVDNFRTIASMNYPSTNVVDRIPEKIMNNSRSLSFEVGDIVLQGVQNVDELAEGIHKHLGMSFAQNFSKYF